MVQLRRPLSSKSPSSKATSNIVSQGEAAAVVGGLLFGIVDARKAAASASTAGTASTTGTPSSSATATTTATNGAKVVPIRFSGNEYDDDPSNLMVSSYQSSPSSTVKQLLASMNTPSEVLEILLAGEQEGYVSPVYTKMVMNIPANTFQVMTETPSSGDVGFVVSHHVMQCQPQSSLALVQHIQDNNVPVNPTPSPLLGAVEFRGSMLHPVFFTLIHNIWGDPNIDVQFVDVAESVEMNLDFYNNSYVPLLKAQFGMIQGVPT